MWNGRRNGFSYTGIQFEFDLVGNNSNRYSKKKVDANKDDGRLEINYHFTKLPGFSEKLDFRQDGDLFNDVLVPIIGESGKYHLSVDGNSFSLIRHENYSLFKRIVHRGTIFARMSPNQKLLLVEETSGTRWYSMH